MISLLFSMFNSILSDLLTSNTRCSTTILFLHLMAQERPSHSSYINKSTTPMSRPTRPQMISPSPTCTTRGTTPRTTSSAPTVTRRSSWTGGNLEGHTGSPARSARRCLAGLLVVTMATSRHKSQDVARAHHRQVQGRRVCYVLEFVPQVHCRVRQQCLQGRALSQKDS